MSLDSLNEVFIHGNLDIVYNNTDIRNLELCELSLIFLKTNKNNFFTGYEWRLYNNLKFILNCYENYILTNFSKFKKFCIFLENILNHCEKIFNISDSKFNISRKSEKDIFNILMVIFCNNVFDRLQTYKIQNSYIDENIFFCKFIKYLSQIKDKSLFCDFVTPYDNIKWTSKWKIIYENIEFCIEGVDIFLDSYTKNKNFYYNNTMNKDIILLSERINYLKEYTPFYFNIISPHILEITNKMFDIFPYSNLVRDYKKLILSHDSVFRPRLLKDKNIKTISSNYLILSIIPDFLSSYLLGFPVISIDIPSNQTLQKYMEKLEFLGEEKYFNHISSTFNKLKIKSMSFEVNCGNALDEENSYLDLCYNRIIDYNQDDIVSLLNTNVIHYFSCKEFKTILKKKENPYNRQEFNIFYHILENLKFKNKSKKKFSNRGLDLELNGTMLENFEELKEKIIIEKIPTFERSLLNNDLEFLYQPIMDILFNSERYNFN